jgi:hypothetical protein
MLIAKLHLETLSRQYTIKQVKATLKNLSPDLNEMYSQNFARIPAKDRELASNVFAWVALAPSPLSMTELCHAIATDPYNDAISEITEDDLPHPTKVLQACVGLVMIKKEWYLNEQVVLVRVYSFHSVNG